jgi:O-antigen ligase
MSSGEKDRLIRPGVPGRMSRSFSPALERGALVAAIAGAALRWGVSGGTAGTGLNLFIHMLPIVALAVWFAARGLAGGAAWRFSGIEIVVPALTIVEVVSAFRASHRLPGLELAVGHLAYGLFAIFALQALGRPGLSRLLLTGAFTAGVLALAQVLYAFPASADRVASESIELRNRHATGEPFAGFVGPNQLAAFLVLTLPLALGAAVDGRSRGIRGMSVPAAAFAIGSVALVLTGSLGGWVAAAVAATAFAALALTRRRGRGAAVLVGAAAAAAVLALALFTPLLQRAAEKSHSLHVRRAYWTGAARLIAERPVAGVGLGNFEDHYPRVKGEVQQEVKLVHNDYLQVLAETGVIGFLVFGALIALGLRRACAAEAEPPAGPEAPRAWPLTAAGLLAFALLFLRYGDPSLLAGGAAWGLFGWLAGREIDAGPWSRLGAAAGFLGFLTHMTVEFLWVEPGTALAFYAGLALLLSYGAKPIEARLPVNACAAAAGLLALVAAPLFILAGPALAADRETAEAAAALRVRDGAPAAAALAEAAQGHNPLLDEPYLLRGGPPGRRQRDRPAARPRVAPGQRGAAELRAASEPEAQAGERRPRPRGRPPGPGPGAPGKGRGAVSLAGPGALRPGTAARPPGPPGTGGGGVRGGAPAFGPGGAGGREAGRSAAPGDPAAARAGADGPPGRGDARGEEAAAAGGGRRHPPDPRDRPSGSGSSPRSGPGRAGRGHAAAD